MSQEQNSERMYQEVSETSYLIDDSQLNSYEKRVRETVRLYYGQNSLNTHAEVAEELGVRRNTVSRRLNSDEAKSFKKMFTDRDDDEIQRWLEDIAARHFNEAVKGLKTALKRAREDNDVSPQVLTNASLGLLKADERFYQNMQELGIIQKPKERKEVEETGVSEVVFNEELVEAVEEAEDEIKEEVDSP